MRSTRHNHRAQQLEERADRMRHEPTPSEALLFESVRGGRLGVAFRRQVPLLGRYIADLLVPELRLVVEIDGGYHQQRAEADARRDRALTRAGYTVLRLEAELVMRDGEAAVSRIREIIAALRTEVYAAARGLRLSDTLPNVTHCSSSSSLAHSPDGCVAGKRPRSTTSGKGTASFGNSSATAACG